MTGPSILPYVWCVVQVTLLSAIGVAISRCMSRRYPEVATQVTSLATIAILAITVLLPVPLPRVVQYHSAQETVVAQAEPTSGTVADIESASKPNPDQSASMVIDVRSLLSVASQWTTGSTATNQAGRYILFGLAAIVAVFIAWGLCGFYSALRYVARIRRQSVPIADRDANRLLWQLKECIPVQHAVMLCESKEVTSATVVGWRKPMIVLPFDWEYWTDDQLSAALAHELAHIHRGDFLWRLLGSLARAVHFYHPLIHWLVHQLTLSQELAADRLAAAAIGNHDRYLKALSQLAISRDELLRLRTEPIVLPTLSTHLIRRITMLRAKDCSHNRQAPRGLRGLGMGMIVVVGATTMVLRSSAEPLSPGADAAKAQSISHVMSSERQGDLFQREPIDISLIGDNETGAFVIRVGEVARDPAYRPVLDLLDKILDSTCRVDLKLDPVPEFRLEEVDQIMGVLNLTINSDDSPADGERKNFHMTGAPELVIRFHHDVQLQPWIQKNLPSAKAKSEDSLAYFEYDQPALGPPILIAARDSRTVILSFSLEKLQKMANKTAAHQTSPSLATAWKAVDGGLLTILATDTAVKPAEPTSNDLARTDAYQLLLVHARKFSLGIDLAKEPGAVALKWGLVCETEQSAKLVHEAVEALLSLEGTRRLDQEANSEDSEPSADNFNRRFLMQVFANSSSRIVPRDEGSYIVELQGQAEFPFKEMILALVPEPEQAQRK